MSGPLFQRPERLVFRVNSIRDRKGSFINHMRQKYKKNEQLGQMRYTVDMNRTRHSSQNTLAVPEPVSIILQLGLV